MLKSKLLKKIILFSGITLISILAISSLIIAYYVNTINPNDYIKQVETLINENSDYKAKIKGNISWSFFPRLYLKIDDLDLSLKSSKENLQINSKNTEAYINLTSLIFTSVKISSVTLKNGDFKNQKQHISFDEFYLGTLKFGFNVADNLKFKIKDTQIKNFTLKEKGKFDIKKLNLSLDYLSFSPKYLDIKTIVDWQDLKINAKVSFSDWQTETPSGYGIVNIPKFTSQQFIEAFHLPKKINAPKEVSLKLDFSLNFPNLKIKDITMRGINDELITGNLTFDLSNKEKGDFNLLLKNINLGIFSENKAPETNQQSSTEHEKLSKKQKNTSNESTSSSSSTQFQIPFVPARVSGTIKGENIYKNKFKINQLKIDTDIDNGIVNLKPVFFINKHQYSSTAKINTNKNLNEISFSLIADNVDISDFVYLASDKEILRAKTNIKVNVNTKGNSQSQFISNLNGKANVNMEDGLLKGLSLKVLLEEVQNLIEALLKSSSGNIFDSIGSLGKTSLDLKKAFGDNSLTPFSKSSATFNIKNGVVHNDDFTLSHPEYGLNGKGIVNLNNEKISYKLETRLLAEDKNAASKAISFMKNNPFSINISGTISSPIVTPDTETYLNIALKQLTKNIINSLIPVPIDIIPSDGELKPDVSDPVETLKKVIPLKEILPF